MISLTFSGFPQHAVYTATKFAVRGMTQCAAIDYGKYGITVNAYAPGAIETALRAYFEFVPSTHSPDEVEQSMTVMNTTRRLLGSQRVHGRTR